MTLTQRCIYCRKEMLALRRMTARHEDQKIIVRNVYEKYKAQGYVGIFTGEVTLRDLKPAPPPAEKGRSAWKPKNGPKGPIGLLLLSVHMMAAAMDEEMKILKFEETSIDIYEGPWQHLKFEVLEEGVRARHKYAAGQRQML